MSALPSGSGYPNASESLEGNLRHGCPERPSGYVEVKAFNAEPYAHHWFEKTLGKKTQTGRVQ